MAMTVRALLQSIAGLAAALFGGSTIATAEDAAPGTMAALIVKLKSDAALRARFLESPAAVMREQGIDPTPFRLPDRLTQAQLDRLLADWSHEAEPSPPPQSPQPSPPAQVYGPPPGPPRTQAPKPLPPAPVYGPPPGPPR